MMIGGDGMRLLAIYLVVLAVLLGAAWLATEQLFAIALAAGAG
jgi:hypothetical protein